MESQVKVAKNAAKKLKSGSLVEEIVFSAQTVKPN